MNERFDYLEEIIKRECCGRKVIYMPNQGNWGDSLIRHGTLKFFRDIGLEFQQISQNQLDETVKRSKRNFFRLFRHQIFIYGGGGAWCRLWDHSKDYVIKSSKQYRVIVLPSSYENSYSIPNTLFFRRDRFESKLSMPESLFCHDMAFYIGKEFYDANKGKGKGYFLRTDMESSGQLSIPSTNDDLSSKGNHLTPVGDFFGAINEYAEIYTDRLHIAIAGCLLEKKVNLYLGSYFKNRAVYLSSMKKNFGNIYFHKHFSL
jgi:exopolysaccharide biosynthesis predicted pyruvyltransferase EpsI